LNSQGLSLPDFLLEQGINMVFLPRMTAQNPSKSQKQTFGYAIFKHSLFHIFRTCRVKNTGGASFQTKNPSIGREKFLIKGNNRNNELSHILYITSIL